MKHNALVATITLLVLNAPLLWTETRTAENQTRPNLILILADDLGYGSYYVARGPEESRDDAEIFAEANTQVVVPAFRGAK